MMRLEPEERRNYVHSQLDEYGRIYMSCLELFVYKLWSRQRLLLKNNKIYEEKLMTISEVIGTLTQSDQIVDANKHESDKLENVIQRIHRVVFIPPNKEADLHMVNELLVKEAEEGFSDLNISQLLLQQHHIQPSNTTTTTTTTTTGKSSRQQHHQVIKQHSSSSTREATTSRESNSSSLKNLNGTSTTHSTNSSKKSRRESDIKNNGHCLVPNVVSSLSMSIEAPPPKRNSVTINDATTTTTTNTSSATNGKGGDKESDSGLTNRRSMGKRANGSNGGGGNGVPKKSRNNRTKDDKEIVKCCAQKGCEYIERDNANNMRKHYRNWHDDIEYPPAPYVKKEMATETVNQYLHNWMVQRKKRQPPKSRDRPSNDSWQGLPIDSMLVYHDDTGNPDEDYEADVNEQLIASFIKSEKQEANRSP